MQKITIGGIITLLVILSSGTTLYIQSLGEKTGCRAGWVFEDTGEFEGYYKCVTSTNIRYEMCFSVYNSSGTENYWCEKGEVIIMNKEPAQSSGKHYLCSPEMEDHKCEALI